MALLLSHFGELSLAWRASGASLRAAGLPKSAVESVLYHRERIDLSGEVARVDALGAHLLTWTSADYPTNLRVIDGSPPVLYLRGTWLPSDDLSVAVVGTRSPSVYGKEVARQLASGLARSGVTVVSGMALGIDGIAHHAALEAGGRTVAVFGCGVDRIYPSRHRTLASAIMGNGALISDYALGTPPDARNFPPRNRLISGLTLGTLVVEAGARSGALITLKFALEQGRDTFAVPGGIHSRKSDGTNRAIQRGEAMLVTCVEDVLEELNLSMVVQQREVREVVPDTPTEEALLQALGQEPTHIDDIVRVSGLPTATVSSGLCMMELKGMVRRTDNMSYVVVR